MSWKQTLNLPATAFPMRASLTKREPEILARWDEMDLYARVREARAGAELFVLHDGPPYANGDVHFGTCRNKSLKDMTVRYRTMLGLDSPYVPGWDCHGLPIEHNVMKELGKEARSVSTPEIRRRCREYAEKYVDVQRESFRRFGVLGEWQRPYLTMLPEYEAGILSVYADLVEKGYVTRGLRSIHWCVNCKTALAEAELEYGPETSPSIHVRFPVAEDPSGVLGGEKTDVVIWTTTPWTLPANAAVAVHPDLDYALVEHDGPDREQRVLVAVKLVEAYLEAVQGVDHTVAKVIRGTDLVGLVLDHPFLERQVSVVPAKYVSEEDGTGCVHTAPGHGADDFNTGREFDLPILCPVGPNGVYTDEVGHPDLVGLHVFKADAAVLDILRAKNALAAHVDFEHSYPHCWRCKRPVVFRATDQWFVSVDHEDLRARAIGACEDDIKWFPKNSIHRMLGMLRDRPDWCISRQRAWGVPIPAFYCAECDTVHCTAELVRHVRDIVAKDGVDVWFERDAAELTPPGLACTSCGATTFRKETDIFDVWFESGSSWRSVCTEDRGLHYPADVYLEGHDQHRGWFQLSLLPALASTGSTPFKDCVTHGFFNDETGEKVSKSKGGMKELSAQRIFDQIGVDICRLFFVTGDYFGDVPVSLKLVEPTKDVYRKIRNTLRFLLGSLDGFDPSTDLVGPDEMLAVDRWVLHALDSVEADVKKHYDGYAFQRGALALREFMDRDLSAFYLDLVKDRLYCDAADSTGRRSARSAIYRLAHSLVRMWAPILVYTCEEAWDALPGTSEASVHLAIWPERPGADAELGDWVAALRRVRTEVEKKADVLRKDGAVGGGQDIAVGYAAEGGEADALGAGATKYLGSDPQEALLEILGVAEFSAGGDALAETEVDGLRLDVRRSDLVRCERCRRRRPDVDGGADDPLCARCEPWREAVAS